MPVLRFERLDHAVERRSYTYFFEAVVPQFSGHQEKGFWTIALRQISHTSTSLLHAVAALGAIEEHHRAENASQRKALRSLALTQYGQSLSDLRKSMHNAAASALVIIVDAILHITMELTMQLRQEEDQDLAKAQLRTALRFLTSSSHRHTPCEEAVLHRWIQPMLGRCLLQFEPQGKTQTSNDGVGFVELNRNIFDCYITSPTCETPVLDEAHRKLQFVIETTFAPIHRSAANGCTDDVEHARSHGIICLNEWKIAFDLNFAHFGDSRETLLLRILCQSALLIIRTVISTRHLPSNQDFARQIDSCEAFIQLHRTTDNGGAAFFVDHAVIPSLFFAAVQCKDEVLAEQAVRILESRPWREGFWDSRVVAKEARRVRQVLSEQSLQISALGEQPHLGCAWEFLAGSGLIISNQGHVENTTSMPP